MKTLLLKEPGSLVLTGTPEPGGPPDGYALARVRSIGVCGTDIHAFNGRQPFFSYPRILGHELGVELVAVAGDAAGLRAGDRCAVEPYLNCGGCVACRNGKPNCCVNLRVMGVHVDGGQREYIHVPLAKLHRSAALTTAQLALVEPLAIGAHAVDRAAVRAGETVLVIGAGPIGLAVIQFAKAAGARVIALDIDAQRLDFCRRAMAADEALDGAGADIPAELARLTGGDLPTAVFDATGSRASMLASFRYPAHGGRLVFVGLFIGEVSFDDPDFHKRELTLMGSRNARPEDFVRIIGLIEAGRVDTSPWITHQAAFEEVPAAFPEWVRPQSRVLKAMINL